MPRLLVVTPATKPKRITQTLIDAALPFRRYRLRSKEIPPFGGHPAVTRSLCYGLAKIGVDWAPASDLAGKEAEVVVVLAGSVCLRQAIEMKRSGRCARLFAGPNILVRPTDEDGLILSSEIDGVIVPSDYVGELYARQAPVLRGKISVWPAGVDTDYWQPSGRNRDTALVYVKSFKERARELGRLASRYAARTELIYYGWHRMQEYRRALDRAQFCIFLTAGESQGIAMAEAWAMDVPTFVSRSAASEFADVRSAPYLTVATGRLWFESENLAALLSSRPPVAPRRWVLENMTDAVCARRLLHLVGM